MKTSKVMKSSLTACAILFATINSCQAGTLQKVNLAAGWFWGVEAGLQQINGVKTVVGYTGGTFKKPTYQDVCSGQTGHAEAVQVSYDPEKVPLEKILHKFWEMNMPTYAESNRGQYRSAIFFYTKDQEASARLELAKLEESSKRKIYTQILPASDFYRAEEYHQNYYRKHGVAACRLF
jgi:peptide-methionine (S)-S-oxide reductase